MVQGNGGRGCVAWWDGRSAQPRLLTGDWTTPRHTRQRWPLVGILSFADGCSMLSWVWLLSLQGWGCAIMPLVVLRTARGNVLSLHVKGYAAFPVAPVRTSNLPQEAGAMVPQGHAHSLGCSFPDVRTHAGRRSLLQGTGVPGSEADLHPRWRRELPWCRGAVCQHRHGQKARATSTEQEDGPQGRALCMGPPLLTCGGSTNALTLV
jgi:hypothetical protein